MRKIIYIVLYVFLLFSCQRNKSPNMQSEEISKQNNTVLANKNSIFKLDSAKIIRLNGDEWYIGMEVNDIYKQKSNVTITSDLFGVPFGPIDGYDDGEIRIGWNNRNRVLYIEVLSPNVKTYDGLTLGDSKEKVLNILGVPYKEIDNGYRYQNIDFEIVGILFQFENDKISRIIVFSYV